MNNKEVLEVWFSRVWDNADASAIDEMLVTDTKARGIGKHPRIGPNEFKAFHSALLSLVTDVKISVDQTMQQDDWISALCTMTCKCKSSGKPAEITGHTLVKIIDGKLVDAHNHFDFMGLFMQLGLLPDNTFETCLCGKKAV